MKMINISAKHYIGEGDIRTCYEHPENKFLCIKIPKPHVKEEYTNKELRYFKKIKKHTKNDSSFYSDYRGEVSTNLGIGQTFDLIRDESTGKISKTLEFYLLQNQQTIPISKLEKALSVLKDQMLKYKVFTRDLRARNICCKKLNENKIELVIIDGLGHSDFFPFADYVTYFSKRKLIRSYHRWHFNTIQDQINFLKI